MRETDAKRAAIGPVQTAQADLHDCSFAQTLATALLNSSLLRHCSQIARDQNLRGSTCASNAGSTVPVSASAVNKIKSVFLPPPGGARLLATSNLDPVGDGRRGDSTDYLFNPNASSAERMNAGDLRTEVMNAFP